ncbi:MAG: twitching motility protein PilT [Actinomycetota bacterium]|nr:twitching motility protein PilT [Actinomycetota bacterium]
MENTGDQYTPRLAGPGDPSSDQGWQPVERAPAAPGASVPLAEPYPVPAGGFPPDQMPAGQMPAGAVAPGYGPGNAQPAGPGLSPQLAPPIPPAPRAPGIPQPGPGEHVPGVAPSMQPPTQAQMQMQPPTQAQMQAPVQAQMQPPTQAPAPPPPAPGPLDLSAGEDRDFSLTAVLETMLAVGASDLHLSVGSAPLARVDGELGTLDGFGVLGAGGIQRALYTILTQRQRERFEADLELDLAYALPGQARFRVNLYRQRETIGAAFRRIPFEIKSLEELGIPAVVGRFAFLPRGMVLVTGSTGSGKSTTLAAIVDQANRGRHDHIMTVEDPIEFLHMHKGCLVNQREVGEDTHSFTNALRHALRQDPDIILVGEMRDLETISVALTAAETGHLVLGTLHTQDAAQTIDRIVDVFPPHQQQQIRTQLAGVLQGIVCQSLCRRAEGRGRVVATEVLVATPAVRNMIREGKTHQVYSTLQSGAQHGMHTLDQHLADLTRRRIITRESALELCHHHEDFLRLIGAH